MSIIQHFLLLLRLWLSDFLLSNEWNILIYFYILVCFWKYSGVFFNLSKRISSSKHNRNIICRGHLSTSWSPSYKLFFGSGFGCFVVLVRCPSSLLLFFFYQSSAEATSRGQQRGSAENVPRWCWWRRQTGAWGRWWRPRPAAAGSAGPWTAHGESESNDGKTFSRSVPHRCSAAHRISTLMNEKVAIISTDVYLESVFGTHQSIWRSALFCLNV